MRFNALDNIRYGARNGKITQDVDMVFYPADHYGFPAQSHQFTHQEIMDVRQVGSLEAYVLHVINQMAVVFVIGMTLTTKLY